MVAFPNLKRGRQNEILGGKWIHRWDDVGTLDRESQDTQDSGISSNCSLPRDWILQIRTCCTRKTQMRSGLFCFGFGTKSSCRASALRRWVPRLTLQLHFSLEPTCHWTVGCVFALHFSVIKLEPGVRWWKDKKCYGKSVDWVDCS